MSDVTYPCGQTKEWHDTLADIAYSPHLLGWVRWARETIRIDQMVHDAHADS